MSDSIVDPLAAFADNVEKQLARHGYPERRVAFPIERMYEAAANKGLSFNSVLEVLAARGIAHEKTPEKVVFVPVEVEPDFPDMGAFGGLDPSMFAGMSPQQMMEAAQQMMQQLSPEQLASVQSMLEGMTPEQRAQMLEQAKKMGLG